MIDIDMVLLPITWSKSMADQGKEIHQKECCKFGVLFWLFNLLLFSFSLSSSSWLPELAGSVITEKNSWYGTISRDFFHELMIWYKTHDQNDIHSTHP